MQLAYETYRGLRNNVKNLTLKDFQLKVETQQSTIAKLHKKYGLTKEQIAQIQQNRIARKYRKLT